MNPWEKMEKITPDVQKPSETIEELFSGLEKYTEDKVGFRLHEVLYFPEEVTYSTKGITSISSALSHELIPTKNRHPEFGYNPDTAKSKTFFRYRILLYPKSQMEIEYELFKVKYPILFYPVIFYLDKTDFKELGDCFDENGKLIAENQPELVNIITIIIKSESTLCLLKRLMAI